MLDAPRFFAALLLAPLVLAPACSTTSSRRDGTAPTSDEARVARLEQERAPASDFLPFLSGAEPATARRAALALGRLERRDALEPLLTALASSDPGLRALPTAAAGAALQFALVLAAMAAWLLAERVGRAALRWRLLAYQVQPISRRSSAGTMSWKLVQPITSPLALSSTAKGSRDPSACIFSACSM